MSSEEHDKIRAGDHKRELVFGTALSLAAAAGAIAVSRLRSRNKENDPLEMPPPDGNE